jgi:hypothetical protein
MWLNRERPLLSNRRNFIPFIAAFVLVYEVFIRLNSSHTRYSVLLSADDDYSELPILSYFQVILNTEYGK